MRSRLFAATLTLIALSMALVLGFAKEAGAHATLAASEPSDGAELGQAPSAVVLTFTEEIDAGVSSIGVLGTGGRSVARGGTSPVNADPKKLRIALTDLDKGVYTVTWKVLSKVDGHVTGGAFAFGVGMSPAGVEIPKSQTEQTPGATVLSVISRVLLYVGLVMMFGAATIALALSGTPPTRALVVARMGLLGALVGVALLAESLRADTGATYSALLGTKTGQGIIWRFGALVIAASYFVAPRRRSALGVFIADSILVVATHVYFGHAGAGEMPLLKIATQTVHISAVSVWIGGLATLLLVIPTLDRDERGRVVRRFSIIAGVALAVVVVTGTLRAWSEVGTWERLIGTGYGRTVLAKIGLLGALALLGAWNRYRNVSRAADTIRGLRRVGAVEVALALIVLVLTGFLASTLPARLVGSELGPKPALVVAEGVDFATTTRARLEASPGGTGPNKFALRLTDFDSAIPITPRRVSLTFRHSVPGSIQPSTLVLRRRGAGFYEGQGSNLALPGPWMIDILVEQETTSRQITVVIVTDAKQQTQVVPGEPTLYNVTLSNNSVQFYVDPARMGSNEVHATYFDPMGSELAGISNAVLIATPPKGDPTVLPVRLLSPGHYVADGDLSEGRWRFDAFATGPAGESLHAYFEQTIKEKEKR